MAGDFRQLPTIIPRASRAQIINASLKKSKLWHHFKVMSLRENMRIKNNGDHQGMVDFDKWLLRLGEGTLDIVPGTESYATLPESQCVETEEDNLLEKTEEAIAFTFGDIESQSALSSWPDYVSKRAILAPTSKAVNDINDMCLRQLPGEDIVIPSVDYIIHPHSVFWFSCFLTVEVSTSKFYSHNLK